MEYRERRRDRSVAKASGNEEGASASARRHKNTQHRISSHRISCHMPHVTPHPSRKTRRRSHNPLGISSRVALPRPRLHYRLLTLCPAAY